MDEEEINWAEVDWTDSKLIWDPDSGLYKQAFGEEENEVASVDEENKYHIYICLKCRYILDETKEPHKPLLKELLDKDGKCPNCGNKIIGNYLCISEKKMKKEIAAQKNKERKKKIREEKVLENAKKNIRLDCSELLIDLKDRLVSGKITKERFVALYLHLTFNIVKYYEKKLPEGKELPIDMARYRKTFIDLCDVVLNHYNFVEKSSEILNEYDEKISEAERLSEEYQDDIQKDKLFIAQQRFLFDDDKFALPQYDLDEKMEEYNDNQEYIKNLEFDRRKEEIYQEKLQKYEGKIEERKIRRSEMSLA